MTAVMARPAARGCCRCRDKRLHAAWSASWSSTRSRWRAPRYHRPGAETLGGPAQVGELARGGVDADGGGQQRQPIGFLSCKEFAERKTQSTNPETLVC